MSQTAYSAAPDAARRGQLYSATEPHKVVGFTAAEDLYFGRFVKDNFDGSAEHPSADAGTDKIAGVVMATQAIESLNDGSDPHYLEADKANILRQGTIWVWCEEAFDPATDSVFVRFTANGAGKLVGQVRTDADTGKADELGASGYGVPHRVLNELTGAGLLAIEINLP